MFSKAYKNITYLSLKKLDVTVAKLHTGVQSSATTERCWSVWFDVAHVQHHSRLPGPLRRAELYRLPSWLITLTVLHETNAAAA